METYRISEDEIKDLKPVAVGYKMFNNDWTSKYGKYDYKDENGNVIGTIHKVEGDIAECEWGLHFSKEPQDCFYFYESVQWNKFAKVEAYDQVIDCDKKSITNILKIVETYTFDEFVDIIKRYLKSIDGIAGIKDSCGVSNAGGINDSYGVNVSSGVNDSGGINESIGINDSYGVNFSKGISGSYGISGSDGINQAYGISHSAGITVSDAINSSQGVSNSWGVNNSWGIKSSSGINGSSGISTSYGIDLSAGINESNGIGCSYGISESDGVNRSFGILKCEGISRSIFCYKKSGKLMAFNKKISEKRFSEIYSKLSSFHWYPKFNNAKKLKGNLAWFQANISAIMCIDDKTAWSEMPKDMLKYIKSLPEYNEEIFNKIIGGEE